MSHNAEAAPRTDAAPESLAAAKPLDCSNATPLDLAALDAHGWGIWLSGYVAGLDHAHRAEEDREERAAAELSRTAARIVHSMASLPEVPPERQVPTSWTGARWSA